MTASFKGLQPASAASALVKRRNRRSDTTHELLLRRELWRMGVRYRKNVESLPGKPDLVFAGACIVVCCDGDFWHGRHWEWRKPKLERGTNASYWSAKIAGNIERDRRNEVLLAEVGWYVINLWGGVLAGGEDEADYRDLIEDFRLAYMDLSGTVQGIPAFEELVSCLRRAIRHTLVTEVNAARGQTPQPDWRQIYSHIVVGGEVLNRGYTLEGLTVTYMPRGPGMNQADTIQQRARWFGYKADYLGYCRVYLSDEMLRAYCGYVDHEGRLREQLREHRATGSSLRDWRRAFFLDPSLRPTRDMVIDLEPVRGCYADSWFEPKAPHDSPEAVRANRELVARFEAIFDDRFRPDDGHPRRTDVQIHSVASGVPLRVAYEELLTRFRVTRLVDSVQFTGLLLQVGRYLEQHPDATCSVYRMSGGATRERTVDADDQIPTLFQGANYDRSTARSTVTYPGDGKIHVPNTLTVQIHTLGVKRGSTTLAENVPAIAVWVPRAMEAGWVSQPQPN